MTTPIILSTIATLTLSFGAQATPAAQTGIAPSALPPTQTGVTITLSTRPNPPVSGENTFEVTVKNADGMPLANADVEVQLLMPAMPAMSMPEMRSTVSLKATEGADAKPGTYAGRGEVPMPGRWNVTVSAVVDGKPVAQKKFTLSAK